LQPPPRDTKAGQTRRDELARYFFGKPHFIPQRCVAAFGGVGRRVVKRAVQGKEKVYALRHSRSLGSHVRHRSRGGGNTGLRGWTPRERRGCSGAYGCGGRATAARPAREHRGCGGACDGGSTAARPAFSAAARSRQRPPTRPAPARLRFHRAALLRNPAVRLSLHSLRSLQSVRLLLSLFVLCLGPAIRLPRRAVDDHGAILLLGRWHRLQRRGTLRASPARSTRSAARQGARVQRAAGRTLRFLRLLSGQARFPRPSPLEQRTPEAPAIRAAETGRRDSQRSGEDRDGRPTHPQRGRRGGQEEGELPPAGRVARIVVGTPPSLVLNGPCGT
jgi:hypothetical protein